jgi:hypothetical protein
MELVNYYIALLREETENQTSRDSTGAIVRGISDELILNWMNYALSVVSKRLAQSGVSALLAQRTYELSAGQIRLDPRAIGGGAIVKVEYEGAGGNWRKLRQLDTLSPDGGMIGGIYPTRYELFHREIKVWPRITTGRVRVTYRKAYDEIDARRGTIQTISENVAETHVQAITLASDSVLDSAILGARSAITIVNSEGEPVGRNVYYSSYNSGSRTFTLNPEWEIGDSVISVGDYVVGGANSTSHFIIPDSERECVLQFAKAKILKKDGDPQADNEMSLFSEMLGALVESYQETIEDYEFLDEDSNTDSIL